MKDCAGEAVDDVEGFSVGDWRRNAGLCFVAAAEGLTRGPFCASAERVERDSSELPLEVTLDAGDAGEARGGTLAGLRLSPTRPGLLQGRGRARLAADLSLSLSTSLPAPLLLRLEETERRDLSESCDPADE